MKSNKSEINLENLININGISGNEAKVREMIKEEIRKHVNTIEIDKMGNLIAHKKGKRPCVMLAAHMDEIGMMVRVIDDLGKIKFSVIGDVDQVTLIGQRVDIEGVKGIITTKEISDNIKTEKLPTTDDLFIDTGLTKEELEKKIKIGSYIALEQSSFCCLGSNNMISGKALDDRIGCFILIELVKRLRNVKSEIYFVFTVQEEIGLYGAKTSIYKINPDYAIVVDVTNSDEINKTKLLGRGPCITMKDAAMIGNRCLNDWLEGIAKKNKIYLQYDVSDIGTTDALSISLSKGGIPTTVVGVAVKNLHSTIGIAHRKDIENVIKILEGLLKNPPKVCLV